MKPDKLIDAHLTYQYCVHNLYINTYILCIGGTVLSRRFNQGTSALHGNPVDEIPLSDQDLRVCGDDFLLLLEHSVLQLLGR